MNSTLWVAKTGLDAQQTRMQVVSNNLANANTTGFKSGRVIFEDLLYQNVHQAGGQTSQQSRDPTGLQVGTGVRVGSTENMFSQGTMAQTSNPLDVAVNGQGFFQVRMPDGTMAYTRDGTFQQNEQGQVVTANGNIVQPGITIPTGAQSVTIGSDGVVSAQMAGQTTTTQIGTIQLANFVNPAGLQAAANNMFLETSSSGTPITGTAGTSGLGTISQGSLESSNVNVVAEMVNMIETQRAYEMNSKAVAAADQMMQQISTNM